MNNTSKSFFVVEALGNYAMVGENGRLRWHKDMEGKRPFVIAKVVEEKRPFSIIMSKYIEMTQLKVTLMKHNPLTCY